MSAPRGSFAKVFRSLWYGSLAGRADAQLAFVFLLAHVDADGIVDVTAEMIAAHTGLPVKRVRAAIAVLESPDPESRSPDEGGARIVRLDAHRSWGWQIVNHAVYRQRTAADRRADYRRRHLDEVRERDRRRKRATRRRP